MFDIGWGELVVIGIVALIAIGPKELPGVLRTLGQWMGKIKRMAGDFQGQFQEAMREAEMADLKKSADDLKSAVSDIGSFNPLADTQKDIERAFEDSDSKAAPSPTAEPAASTSADPLLEISTPLPDVALPLPEEPAPLSEKDFAASTPEPAKKAGSGG